MDPTACYLALLDAEEDNDLDAAREHAIALRDWLRMGGFLPAGYTSHEVNMVIACAILSPALRVI